MGFGILDVKLGCYLQFCSSDTVVESLTQVDKTDVVVDITGTNAHADVRAAHMSLLLPSAFSWRLEILMLTCLLTPDT